MRWVGRRPAVDDGGKRIRTAQRLRSRISVLALCRKFRISPKTVLRIENGAIPRPWTVSAWQISWIRRAAVLRPQVSREATRNQYGISNSALSNYERTTHKRKIFATRNSGVEVRV